MVQHEKINFTDNKLKSIYEYELLRLSHSIVRKLDDLFEKTPLPLTGYIIQVSAEIHDSITAILNETANLKKLITPAPRGHKEKESTYLFRLERCEHLKSLIVGIELNDCLKSNVRNSLEHFDEYLDEVSLKVAKGLVKDANRAGLNMVLSSRKVFHPEIYPIKIYVIEEKTFYNTNTSINLGNIHSEMSRLLAQLNPDGTFEPSGLMVAIA